MRYPKKISLTQNLEKKNSRFLNNRRFSLQIWANWGCLRGAQYLINPFTDYHKKYVVGRKMTSTHEGTVFKISKIIFNTRIFAIEVIRTAKIV